MADPMADLGGDPKIQDNHSLTTTKEVTDPLVLGTNLQRIDRIRSIMGIASGCVAGIGGLTGLVGFCKSKDSSVLLLPPALHPRSFLTAGCLPSYCYHHSVLLWPACFRLSYNLGVENEFQPASLHETELVRVFDNFASTDSSFVHLVLDTVLRTRLLVLKIEK